MRKKIKVLSWISMMGAIVYAPLYLFGSYLGGRYQYIMEAERVDLSELLSAVLGNVFYSYFLFIPLVAVGAVVHGLVFLGISANLAERHRRFLSFSLAPILPGSLILIGCCRSNLFDYACIILATIVYGYCVSKLKVINDLNIPHSNI